MACGGCDVAAPKLVPPGGGEVVTDRAERTVAILAEHELVDVTWTRYETGERGPEPHIHRRHTDAFYVLSGELVFGVGPETTTVAAPAGTLVLVPAGVVHTFANESGSAARFLNVHAPSYGFAAYLRGDNPGFDSEDPPADGGRDPADVVVRGPGAGEALAMGVVFKAQQGDGDSTFALTELTLQPRFAGPVPHRHAFMVDSFFVLEGELALRLGEEEQRAREGTYALVPPGNVHTFSNPGDTPVHALNLMAPAGLEQYLKEVAAAARDAPPDPQVMAALAARYDFEPA